MHLLINQADFPFAEELLFTLENGWLEQESWQSRPPFAHYLLGLQCI